MQIANKIKTVAITMLLVISFSTAYSQKTLMKSNVDREKIKLEREKNRAKAKDQQRHMKAFKKDAGQKAVGLIINPIIDDNKRRVGSC